MAIPGAVWLIVSERLPHAPAPWWAFLPGAVLVAFGLEVLNLFTVYWLPVQISHKSATYGAIATALALLGWAYILGRVLTASAVLNASLWYRNQRISAHHDELNDRPVGRADPDGTARITPSG